MSDNKLPILALSIRQPWASLIAEGFKLVENRGWATSYRGMFFIHASKAPMEERDVICATRILETYHGIRSQHIRNIIESSESKRGGIIGVSRIVDVVQDFPSPWARHGEYHFVLDIVNKPSHVPTEDWFTDIIPYPGKLGFFPIDRDFAESMRSLRHWQHR